MKKKAIFYMFFIFVTSSLAQVGIGTFNPHETAVLEINSTTHGFLPPRMTTAERNLINAGSFATGLMIYNEDIKCLEFWNSTEWKNPCNITVVSLSVDCVNSGFQGTMTDGVLITSASFDVVLTNSGASDENLTLSNTDITLSGVTGGISVGNPTPTNLTISAGSTVTISYPITGTPTTDGVLTADWVNETLNCSKTRNIADGIAAFTSLKNNQYIFSVNDLVLPLDHQGTLPTGTSINLPYTNGIGGYTAYNSPEISIDPSFIEDGSTDWTFSYNYPLGTFSSSGNLVVNLVLKKNGVETDFDALRVNSITTFNFDFVKLPLVFNDNVLTNTVGLDEGGDAIRGSLSTSANTYDAANINDIVEVTLAEYNNLNVIVPSPFTGGLQDLTLTVHALGYRTMAHDGKVAGYQNLPANNYIFAFAYASMVGGFPAAQHRIGFMPDLQTTSPITMASNIGGPFNHPDNSYKYFVIKRPNVHCGSNPIFVLSSTARFGGTVGTSLGDNSYSLPNTPLTNTSTLTVDQGPETNAAWTPTMQFKSSAQKSW